MKAVLIRKYGADVLETVSVDEPEAGPGEVLIEIQSAAVNPIDWKLATGALRMIHPLKFPAIMGFDVSGRVVSGGGSRFKEGDAVFARSGRSSGETYAEYVALSEDDCALKPEELSFDHAAAIPLAGLTALQALRDKGEMQPKYKVMVNGASGGVGLFAVQIAKAMGGHVTGVCGTSNMDMVRDLGADTVLDYKKGDPLASEYEYDIIFDAVATLKYGEAKRRLGKQGIYITTVPDGSNIPGLIFSTFLPGKKARFIAVKSSGRDLEYLADLVREGKLKAVIDSTFSLDQVREAHQRSQSGRAQGKIIIKVR